jgi:NADH-quinone oxidoreductase subunit E
VGELLGMAKIRVLEVATFYTMFNLAPVGRFHVQFCGTTPCMLRGADHLKKVLHRMIGHENEVSADRTFSWTEVECLGACVNAPMVQINADYYEDLTPETLTRILNDLAAGKSPKPGPQIDRQNSAPVGGPTTLTDPSLYEGKGRPAPAAPNPPTTDSSEQGRG